MTRRLDDQMTRLQAVVLLSGGLDSYTAAAIAKADGFVLNALTIHYGQRHAREVEAARLVGRSLGVARHQELSVDLRGIRRPVVASPRFHPMVVRAAMASARRGRATAGAGR